MTLGNVLLRISSFWSFFPPFLASSLNSTTQTLSTGSFLRKERLPDPSASDLLSGKTFGYGPEFWETITFLVGFSATLSTTR
jgi:hypothetical protein